MGRLPKIRLSFRDDMAFLLRLEEAIESDTKLSAEDRRKLMLKSSELRMEMAKIDQARMRK